MGSTHKSVWHTLAPEDMTPAFGADSHLSTSVRDTRLLWSRIRLFCTLQTVAILEYPLFKVRLYLKVCTVSMCYHRFQSQWHFSQSILLDNDLYSLHALLLSGMANMVSHLPPAALLCPCGDRSLTPCQGSRPAFIFSPLFQL